MEESFRGNQHQTVSQMNKNVPKALVGLIVFVALFACGVWIEVKFFQESLCFAVIWVMATLASLAFWELVSDDGKNRHLPG